MKLVNCQWFSVAVDGSSVMSHTRQLSAFLHGIDVEFNLSEELAALMPMEGSTTGAETSWTGDGLSSKYGQEEQWRVFSLHQRREAYRGNRELRMCHCLMYQENLCVQNLSELVTFFRSEGMNESSPI
jgi:hypothetical protein